MIPTSHKFSVPSAGQQGNFGLTLGSPALRWSDSLPTEKAAVYQKLYRWCLKPNLGTGRASVEDPRFLAGNEVRQKLLFQRG